MPRVKIKNADDTRKSCVNFSLSRKEKRTIAERADKMGISMSAYIRYKLFYENQETKA